MQFQEEVEVSLTMFNNFSDNLSQDLYDDPSIDLSDVRVKLYCDQLRIGARDEETIATICPETTLSRYQRYRM